MCCPHAGLPGKCRASNMHPQAAWLGATLETMGTVQKPRELMRGMLVAAGGLCRLAAEARADAIDGEWCLGPAHFAIDGPNILTPGGNRIQGNYSRHGFLYVVPANEP